MLIFIGIGSNLGEKQKNCEKSITYIIRHPQIRILKTSKWYETQAVSLPGEIQPDFINGVVQIETMLAPEVFYQELKKIEAKMGRTPNPKKWQPRVIDLDILFYGNKIVETHNLKIPHPLAHERLFVLEPLNEIAPDFVHPILKITVARLYQDLLDRSK